MSKYAGIVVNNESIQLDKIFTYRIPEALSHISNPGYRVKVPFGKGNKIIDGFILYVYDHIEDKSHIVKDIVKVYDKEELFTQSDIKLMEFMRENYLCTYLEAVKLFIPRGVIQGMKNKVIDTIYLSKELDGKYNKTPYIEIYNFIKENEGVFTKTQLAREKGFSISSINTLIKHGYIVKDKKVVDRYNDREYKNYERKLLNHEQKLVVDKVLNSSNKLFLLKGITGSGKTEVYMNIVQHMMDNNKSSIILVPEIALTPQMIERFKGRFGKDVAVFHSKLSQGERYDEWFRVKEGKVKLAIGARSAIFLPFKDLGLIVIDEEHETSYKSESDPKYNARDIAEYKSKLTGCKVIMGSATPNIESYYRTKINEIELLELNKRADGANLPFINTVDMREELKNNNRSIFSRELYEEIKNTLSKKEQIILFLNRRGFSTFVSCRKCGYVFKCDNCDISMTYHAHGNYLSCHYCGRKIRALSTCPKCKSNYVKYFGIGTEKVEIEIKKAFPSARVLRMDLDTTRKKDSYEIIYKEFKEGNADILIGTQMVAKGLDFPNVTLVGVLAADLSLNFPDYRSSERTFQLITQVAGRAGRGKKSGKVIVQTYMPESYSIIFAKNYDYEGFYKDEINIRKDMKYPPFSKILSINLSSKNENLLIKIIQNIGVILKNYLKNSDNIEILGPCPCIIGKIKEFYRWQIIIKGDIDTNLGKNIKDMVYHMTREVYNDIRVSIDINPSNLI